MLHTSLHSRQNHGNLRKAQQSMVRGKSNQASLLTSFGEKHRIEYRTFRRFRPFLFAWPEEISLGKDGMSDGNQDGTSMYRVFECLASAPFCSQLQSLQEAPTTSSVSFSKISKSMLRGHCSITVLSRKSTRIPRPRIICAATPFLPSSTP